MPLERAVMIEESLVWLVRQREYRHDIRTASIVSKIHNVNLDSKKRHKALDPNKMVPPPERYGSSEGKIQKKRMSKEESAKILREKGVLKSGPSRKSVR